MKILLISFIAFLAISGCSKKAGNPPVSTVVSDTAYAIYIKQDSTTFYNLNKLANTEKDSQQVAYAYHYMARMQEEAGDNFGSQESVLSSLQYLKKEKNNDHYLLAINYNTLGNTSLNLKRYDEAIVWYDSALHFNPQSRIYYLNNKALAYQKKDNFSEAVAIYQELLHTKIDSIKEYARILSNMAKSKWLENSSYNAAPELHTALAIRRSKNDNRGLNASYAHLSDYFSSTRPDSALYYAKEMYKVARSLDSPDDELEALQKLIKLENPATARTYLYRHLQLNDSLQNARNSAKNQFALVRFDSEKSKAENLVLQADNTNKKNRIVRQRFLFISLLFITLSLGIIAVIWYKKRKQKLLLESRNAIQQQQLKLSAKVHDVVANGLYLIMSEIEHKEISKEKILDKIEILYEQSRDLSYELPVKADESYPEKINNLLASFSGEKTKVLIVGNNEDFWKDLSLEIRKKLEFVLQELMINMKKHSGAHHVSIKLEHEQGHYTIRYTDDGVGMKNTVKQGNGLVNTETRIRSIGGSVNFEPGVQKGLKILISFPNHK